MDFKLLCHVMKLYIQGDPYYVFILHPLQMYTYK